MTTDGTEPATESSEDASTSPESTSPEAEEPEDFLADVVNFTGYFSPLLAKLFFWIGSIFCVALGTYALVETGDVVGALAVIVGGPVILRILAELVMVPFDIKESLEQLTDAPEDISEDGQ